MKEIENELAKASAKTISAQEHASGQIQYRNHMIVEALKAGSTWARVIELTGLSRQTIANIVRSAK